MILDERAGRNAESILGDLVSVVIRPHEQAIVFAESVIEASHVRVVALVADIGIEEVVLPVDRGRLVGQGVQRGQAHANGIQQVLGNDVASDRVPLEAAVAGGPRGKRVVDLIPGSKREQGRKIAHFLGGRGYRAGLAGGGGRAGKPVLFPGVEEESLVAAVIQVRHGDGPCAPAADRAPCH